MKIETIHWYAIRISFVECPTMLTVIKARSKGEALSKLPKGYQTGGYCIECRSFDDEGGAKWQKDKWLTELAAREER